MRDTEVGRPSDGYARSVKRAVKDLNTPPRARYPDRTSGGRPFTSSPRGTTPSIDLAFHGVIAQG